MLTGAQETRRKAHTCACVSSRSMIDWSACTCICDQSISLLREWSALNAHQSPGRSSTERSAINARSSIPRSVAAAPGTAVRDHRSLDSYTQAQPAQHSGTGPADVEQGQCHYGPATVTTVRVPRRANTCAHRVRASSALHDMSERT